MVARTRLSQRYVVRKWPVLFRLCFCLDAFNCILVLSVTGQQVVTSICKGKAIIITIIIIIMIISFMLGIYTYIFFFTQYSEGPATGHLDTGNSWFLCA